VPAEIKPQAKPDLALERERAARAQRELQELERIQKEKLAKDNADKARARKEKEQADLAKKERQELERIQKEKLAKDNADKARALKEKEHADLAQKEREEADRIQKEKIAKDNADQAKALKEAREKADLAQETAERLKKAQRKRHDEEIARLQSEAGEGLRPSSSGGSSSASSGGGSSNRDAEWQARVTSTIRENTTFFAPPDMVGNPLAVFRVTLSPDCALVRVDLIASSGVPIWDKAAERAILKTNPFPKHPGGQCPRILTLNQRP
jgi:colicin import membrane protein